MDRLLTGGWIYDVELSKPPKNGNGLLCLMFAIKICLSSHHLLKPFGDGAIFHKMTWANTIQCSH